MTYLRPDDSFPKFASEFKGWPSACETRFTEHWLEAKLKEIFTFLANRIIGNIVTALTTVSIILKCNRVGFIYV